MEISFLVLCMKRQSVWLAAPPVFNEARIYMIPNSLKTIRMTAITSSVWTTLPVRGKPEKIFGPKYPSSHSTSRITIIQVSMRFLLLNDSLV